MERKELSCHRSFLWKYKKCVVADPLPSDKGIIGETLILKMAQDKAIIWPGLAYLFQFTRQRDSDMTSMYDQRSRKVNVKLPGKGNSKSHGERPVHLIITMIKWIWTSRLSTKDSLSLCRV